MSATPLNISIVPDLSVIKWFGRNDTPTVFTLTNNDDRDIISCKLHCVRGDFLPKGTSRSNESALIKKGIGEDLITNGWLEGAVGAGTWAPVTDIAPLDLGTILSGDSIEFSLRLVIPATVTHEGKTNFAIMIAATGSEIPPIIYTITASAGTGGSISPSGSVEVVEGDNQPFTISASSGYAIDDVLVDSSSIGATGSYTFTDVSANHTISASFVETHTIIASAGANGSITPSGSITVIDGDNQPFTIAADEGFEIEDVLVDSSSIGATGSYTFTNVTDDHTISASFVSAEPVPLENLVAWYDASDPANFVLSGSTILQALDKSGNNNHATQFGSYALPTLSGGAMNFSGTQMMQMPAVVAPMSNPCTIYMVVNSTSIAPKGCMYCGCTGGGSSIYAFLSRLGGSYVSIDVFWRNFVATVETPNVSYGVTHRIVNRTNGSTDLSVYIDGDLKVTETGTSMSIPTNQYFVLGAFLSSLGGTPGNYFVGFIKEMLIYHTNHTPEQIAEINDYLSSKYP